MKRLLSLCILGISAVSFADTTYLGLYLKGHPIGYSSYDASQSEYHGKAASKSTSKTVMDASLLGQAMTISMNSTTWSTKAGEPLRMLFDSKSGGRENRVDAEFGRTAVVLNIENGGVKTRRTITIPPRAQIVDDPLSLVLNGTLRSGSSRSLYVLDPTTVSFMKNEVHFVGPSRTTVDGKSVSARLIRITDARSVTDVYISAKGDLIRVEGAMGIYMTPVSKKVALASIGRHEAPIDLGEAASIKATGEMGDPEDLTRLKLRITSGSISTIPSDTYQTATKSRDGWVLDIHPPRLITQPRATISQASRTHGEWLKPSMNMPCDSPMFRHLAHNIVDSQKEVHSAAFAVQKYVYDTMKPNAGIGVLRDATEVLKTKEGVCRDYATLTVTLLRAANIPARLVSGLVSWDGTFYYHAWAEAWDGATWIGVDSTTDRAQMCASHVKLGEGNVETAFSFSFLENAKIDVLEARKD